MRDRLLSGSLAFDGTQIRAKNLLGKVHITGLDGIVGYSVGSQCSLEVSRTGRSKDTEEFTSCFSSSDFSGSIETHVLFYCLYEGTKKYGSRFVCRLVGLGFGSSATQCCWSVHIKVGFIPAKSDYLLRGVNKECIIDLVVIGHAILVAEAAECHNIGDCIWVHWNITVFGTCSFHGGCKVSTIGREVQRIPLSYVLK